MAISFPGHMNPAAARTRERLLVAFGLSLALHLTLLLGLPVSPRSGLPIVTPTISVRLETSTGTAPEQAASELQPQDIAADGKSGQAAIADPLADPVNAKTEPKPEPKPERPAAPAVAASPSAPSSGIELPLIRDPTFYPASQLDVYPQPVAPIQLPYPDSAVADRVDGSLLVLLLIDEFGVVSEVSVIEANPAGYFEEAARAVFRATRFSPGMRQGRAVKSRMPFRIRYTYDKSAGTAS